MTDAAHDRSDPTTAPLSTVAREWTRIGVTGFGGPPAHIALFRRPDVDRALDGRPRVRGCERGLRPAARPGLDPARDLLRLSRRRAAGRDRRRARIRPSGGRARPRAVGAVLRARARRSGCAAPAPARRRRRGRRRPRGRSPCWAELRARARRPRAAGAGPSTSLRRRAPPRSSGRISCSSCSPAASRARAAGPPFRHRRAVTGCRSRRCAEAVAVGGLGALCLDRVQGRRPLLRRRLRDHPADAGRRGRQVPLDDQCGVPQRRRARPGHARARRRDDRRGGLCRARDRRWLLAAAVAFTPSFSFILLGGGRFRRLRASHRARAFLDGAGPAAIGAILGAAITLPLALRETWQFGVLIAAAIALLVLRQGVVATLLAAGAIGVVVALAGGPLP